MPDIYTVLHDDHEELEKMLGELAKSGRSGLECASAELQAHWEAEEAVLYPPLGSDEQAAALITEAMKVHQEARSLTLEMALGLGGTDDFATMVQRLREAMFVHMEQEEGAIFDRARQVLTAEQAETLGAEFERQRTLVKGRLAGSRPY
jgi:hemerythrin superfamily protein